MKSSPDAMTQQIRVLLADDHPVVREGLAAILKSQKDIEIVAEAANGEEACELYDQLSPDVLLLDLRMPKKDGLQVITELMTRSAPKPRIMVMTFYESEQDIRRVLKAGAKAFLVKGSHPQQIREAVRRVAQGENFLPPEIGFKLAESMSHPELSNRETQVLQYLACGRSNKEIGRALYISEGTVKHHVKSILSKLDAIGRAEGATLSNLAQYLEMFESRAKANGVTVHWAQDAHEHNRIVYQLLSDRKVDELIKSKSMLTEECDTRRFLEERGIRVSETDLGERIQQLDDQPPSHIVGPAWHKTTQDIANVFAKAYGSDKEKADPVYLAHVMRENTGR
jgi:two-component system NarL family response regulator